MSLKETTLGFFRRKCSLILFLKKRSGKSNFFTFNNRPEQTVNKFQKRSLFLTKFFRSMFVCLFIFTSFFFLVKSEKCQSNVFYRRNVSNSLIWGNIWGQSKSFLVLLNACMYVKITFKERKILFLLTDSESILIHEWIKIFHQCLLLHLNRNIAK